MFYNLACFLYSNEACTICPGLMGSSFLSSSPEPLHNFQASTLPGFLQILLAQTLQEILFQAHLSWSLTRTTQFSFCWLLSPPICHNLKWKKKVYIIHTHTHGMGVREHCRENAPKMLLNEKFRAALSNTSTALYWHRGDSTRGTE